MDALDHVCGLFPSALRDEVGVYIHMYIHLYLQITTANNVNPYSSRVVHVSNVVMRV